MLYTFVSVHYIFAEIHVYTNIANNQGLTD